MKSLFRCTAIAVVFAAASTCATVFAQDYPVRPVTVIIPFSAGSASDVIGRIVLDRMGTSMGHLRGR